MGTIERKKRARDKTSNDILEAALKIANSEGWQALSIRKIADIIEYTAPVIYDHFLNKEAIIQELNNRGYQKLTVQLERAKNSETNAAKQMLAMWSAYWDFAFANKETYKLMFGVNTLCCKLQFPSANYPYEFFRETIMVLGDYPPSYEEMILSKYYAYWGVIHGLIAITLINKGVANLNNKEIMTHEITAITNAILI